MRGYSTLILLSFLVCVTYAQENDNDFFRNERRAVRFNAGLPVITPFIFPAYTPEMGVMVAGGGLLSFKTKRNNPYLSHSTLPLTVALGSKSSFYGSVNLHTYWFDDRLRFDMQTRIMNRHDNYWGVGIDKGFDIEQGDNTTHYHRNSYWVNPSLEIRILENLYGGLMANFRKTQATEIAPLMMEDPKILSDGTTVLSNGLGIVLSYDSRDFRLNPESGVLVKFDAVQYDESLGSDYNYRYFELDYRQYIAVVRNGSKLAWRYNARIGTGNMPWTDMSTLGGYYDLRGYYRGQFRDRSMMYVILEYRHKFYKLNSVEFSRHGVVFWIGGGTVFESPQSIKRPLTNTGIGYRFEVQPRMNLRIDIGFGTESVGVYLGFNEAF